MRRTRPDDSREALMAAGAGEFAAHGFAGASVDTIARRARVNKAMIYYHFKSKQRLYVEILRRVFGEMGERTARVAASPATAPQKVAAFIAAINATADERPYLPWMMMREILDGARHLDPDTLRLMSRLLANFRAILDQGRREGVFGDANPLLSYFSILAPLLFFRAAAPIRAAMSRHHIVEEATTLDLELFLSHLTARALQGLAADAPATATPARRRRPAAPARHRSGADA